VIRVNNNPKKSTSVAQVPLQNTRYPVVWNEPIDLIMKPSANKIFITVWDQDFQSDDVVGSAVILVDDFFKAQKTKYCCFNFGDEEYPFVDPFHKINLTHNGKGAGSLWVTFMIHEEHETFPEYLQAHDQYKGLIQDETRVDQSEVPNQMEMKSMAQPLV